MEVHHHAHTARKKWTHYFWEFLMLFLAVTLGFFVENQREHYIEQTGKKIYTINLLQDLATLTLSIITYQYFPCSKEKDRLHQLITMIYSPGSESKYLRNDLYYFTRMHPHEHNFLF